jgi:hypothetical protein
MKRGRRALLAILAACLIPTTAGLARAPTWTIQNVPPDRNPLVGVSCTSSSACTGVGYFFGPTASRWDGESWAVQTVPNPNPQSNYGVGWGASAVSCAASNA